MYHREAVVEVPDDDETFRYRIADDVASECPGLCEGTWSPKDFFAYPVRDVSSDYIGSSDVEAEEIQEDGAVG